MAEVVDPKKRRVSSPAGLASAAARPRCARRPTGCTCESAAWGRGPAAPTLPRRGSSHLHDARQRRSDPRANGKRNVLKRAFTVEEARALCPQKRSQQASLKCRKACVACAKASSKN
eukprot:2687297-Pleurochrysis_carterae.AAC.1